MGLHFVSKKKPGRPIRWYVYAWRGGPCIATRVGGEQPRLTGAEMRAAGEAIEAAHRPDPRILRSLIREWQASPEWKGLAAGTRKTWGSQLNAIEAKWGESPVGLWSDPRMVAKVVAWRDSRASTPRAADIGITVLKELLQFGRLRARVTINVAADIPTLYRGGDREDIIWTDEDIDRFQWQAARMDQSHIVDGLWLAALTGFRRADLVTASKVHVLEHALQKRALKKSRGKRFLVTMPRLPELDSLLEELDRRPRADGVETLLVNSFGRPWTGDGFGGSFNRIRDAAGIVHTDQDSGEQRLKHLHDVRGTFCTKMILAGIRSGEPLTDEEVGHIMGWSPERVANIRRTYVDQARVVVAIGERIAKGSVNRSVNRSSED
jgi:hypothetical protein